MCLHSIFFPSYRPKELPHDCVVDIISEAATDRDVQENENRIIQAARAAVNQTQREREREREIDLEKEWGQRDRSSSRGRGESYSEDRGGNRERDRDRDRNVQDRDEDESVEDWNSDSDGGREAGNNKRRGMRDAFNQEADSFSDEDKGYNNWNDDVNGRHQYNRLDRSTVSEGTVDVSDRSSLKLRHTLSGDKRRNGNGSGNKDRDRNGNEEKFNLQAAYRELCLDPEGLKKRASFSQSMSRRPRTVRVESRSRTRRSTSKTPSRNSMKDKGSRSLSRDRNQRMLLKESDPRSISQDFSSSDTSRLSSPPHRSRYSPLGSANYFPLRSSPSARPLPSHVPMDLHDRNQAAIGYIVSSNEENYTKALTTAVETVVNNYFR